MCLKLAIGYLLYDLLQILVSFISLSGTTRGFLFDVKCVAPPPCTCHTNYIHCDNKHLSQVPVFTRHNEHDSSILLYLNNNELTTIPAYAFKNLSAVNATSIDLYLYDNRISSIQNHAFNGVENAVTYLNLKNNNLTHLPIALTELSSLQRLNLLGNPLGKLDVQVLSNISSSLNSFSIFLFRFTSFPNEL